MKEVAPYVVIEMIWHVAEIMLFTKSAVLPGLLEWVEIHMAPRLEASFKTLCLDAVASEDPYSFNVHEHDEYWPSICAYLVRGMTRQVQQLLDLHPLSVSSSATSDDNAFVILNNLLKSMPMKNADLDEAHFETALNKWTTSVAATATRQDIFVNRPRQLKTIFQILSGDAAAIGQVSNDWVIMLLGTLTYAHPMAKAHEVKAILASVHAMEEKRYDDDERSTGLDWCQQSEVLAFVPTVRGQSDTVDSIVSAIFQLDTQSILIGVLDYGNPWFSAHFLDLFSFCDASPFELIDPANARSGSFHEHALLVYVTSLIADDLPLRLLADYLGCCPEFGRDHLAALICRQPVSTEREACKLLSLCQTFQLGGTTATAKLVQTVVSNRAKRSQFASALSWAQHASQAHQLSTALLDSVIIPISTLTAAGATPNLANHTLKLGLVVQALSSSPPRAVETTVHFLRLYHQTLKVRHEGDLKETAILLGRSLGAELAPKRFWLPILYDCVLLLDALLPTGAWPVFSSSEIYDLMQCLEETEKRTQAPDAAKFAKIRLTLSHQLSEAILSGI